MSASSHLCLHHTSSHNSNYSQTDNNKPYHPTSSFNALEVLQKLPSESSLEPKMAELNASRVQVCPLDELSVEGALELRRQSPVSTQSIQAQARLHQAIRQAKVQANSQSSLTPLGTSENSVYCIYKPAGSDIGTDGTLGVNSKGVKYAATSVERAAATQPAAYLKVGKDNEEAAATMEKLIWDMAVALGLESQFTATTTCRIYYDAVDPNSSQTPTPSCNIPNQQQWTASGDLAPPKMGARFLQGSVQEAQKDQILDAWYDSKEPNKPSLDKASLNQSTVTSLVFGMWDAHFANIFVDGEGNIKYFDNTRSLPNSNGLIDRVSKTISAYRSALLDLPESYSTFTAEERGQLKALVCELEKRYDDFEAYMYSEGVQKRIKSLPQNWLDLDKALEAMEERIAFMKCALEDDNVNNLVELTLRAVPGYKLSMALEVLHFFIQNKLSAHEPIDKIAERALGQYLHTHIGSTDLETLLRKIADQGIDLKKITSFCKIDNLSYLDLINHCCEVYKDPASPLMTVVNEVKIAVKELEQAKRVIGNCNQQIIELRKQQCQKNREKRQHNSNRTRQHEESKKLDADIQCIEANIERNSAELSKIYECKNEKKADIALLQQEQIQLKAQLSASQSEQLTIKIEKLRQEIEQLNIKESTLDELQNKAKEDLLNQKTLSSELKNYLMWIEDEIKRTLDLLQQYTNQMVELKECKKCHIDLIKEKEFFIEESKRNVSVILQNNRITSQDLLAQLKATAMYDLKDVSRDKCKMLTSHLITVSL
jgi:hypothetical protein